MYYTYIYKKCAFRPNSPEMRVIINIIKYSFDIAYLYLYWDKTEFWNQVQK